MLANTPCYKINLPSLPPGETGDPLPDQIGALLREAKPDHHAVLTLGVGTGCVKGSCSACDSGR